MSAKKLAKCIVSSYRVTSVLDWKKHSILSLVIRDNQVDLALAGTVNDERIIYPLKTITNKNNSNSPKDGIENNEIQKRAQFKKHLCIELEKIVRDNRVGGFVVNWPIRLDGRCGKSCGKVLHILDYLVGTSSTNSSKNEKSLINVNRPLAFWDEVEINPSLQVDEWGRSEVFSRTPALCSEHIVNPDDEKDLIESPPNNAALILETLLNHRYLLGEGEKYHLVDTVDDVKHGHRENNMYYESEMTYHPNVNTSARSMDEYWVDDDESMFLQPRLL